MLRGFEYLRGDSPIHRLDPRVKILYSLAYSALCFVSLKASFLALLLVVNIPILVIGKVFKRWLNMMKGAVPLIALIFLFNVLFQRFNNIYGAVAYTLRFIIFMTAFAVLFLTTTPEDLALVMVKLKIPYEYTLAFTMAIRFVPTLSRELQIIIDTQRSRGLELEKGNILERIRKYMPILIPLIVHEIRRSYTLAEAMESRGFGYTKNRTYYYEMKFTKKDAVSLLCIMVSAVFLGILGKTLLWPF